MGDEDITMLIIEHLERSVRGISRLFRILVSRLSDNRSDQISDQLLALNNKLDDNCRILQEIKQNTNRFDDVKSRYAWSPSCVSFNDSSDDFVLSDEFLLDP